MGERGTPDARHQLDQQIRIVETCARELDPRLWDRVSALRRRVIAQPTNCLRGKVPSAESVSTDLHAAVRQTQELLRILRGIIAAEGEALIDPDFDGHLSDVLDAFARAATARTLGNDEVQHRCAVLLELEEELFRVSDTMWGLLRSAGVP
jgi:hypothetical protein